MSIQQGIVEQNLIEAYLPRIEWQKIQEAEFSESHIRWLLGQETTENSLRSCKLGMSASFSKTGSVPAIAFAHASRDINQPSRILIFLPFSPTSIREKHEDLKGRQLLETEITTHPDITLFAFDIADLILLLHHHLRIHISSAIDIQSALPLDGSRKYSTSLKFILGDKARVHREPTKAIFSEVLFDESTTKANTSLVLRAWLSAHVATMESGDSETIWASAPKINTAKLNSAQLYTLAKLAHDRFRRDSQQSTSTQNSVSSTSWNNRRGKLQASSARYQDRIVRNSDLILTVSSPTGDTYQTSALVSTVAGSAATIEVDDNLSGKIIASIQSVDKRAPTQAEVARQDTVLRTLQGLIPLWDNPWLQSIWLTDEVKWPEDFHTTPQPPVSLTHDINPNYPLNHSQTKAVEHMVSTLPDHRITLIQGPPGTGKTSVIATYVLNSIQAGRKGIWLVAQSNVAVKNIAEKLVNIGFTQFRLLVSADFHFGWHEHLYHEIGRNMISSDDFPRSFGQLVQLLQGAQVMLCTLSMLSSKRLKFSGFFRAVPLINLIIDEASQIEIGDYVPVFSNHNSIQKVCFIGDDKQLPPHGTEEIEVLQSIFEREHLRSSALFLDTQYRMPPQIGDFISKQVYDHQLLSNPDHKVTSATLALHLIDVQDGTEIHSGTSWINYKEAEAVLHVARFLHQENLSFRIITPYDPQRGHIEQSLKDSEDALPWENTVFNVDAFQGNEEDYIIVSVVRTRDLGFLTSLRRVNVMLTRCKRGMYICSNRKFLEGKGATSLVGAMAKKFEGRGAWASIEDIKTGSLKWSVTRNTDIYHANYSCRWSVCRPLR